MQMEGTERSSGSVHWLWERADETSWCDKFRDVGFVVEERDIVAVRATFITLYGA